MRRVPHSPLQPGSFVPPDDIAHYLARVLRMHVGDAVVLFDPESAVEAVATLESLAPLTLLVRELSSAKPRGLPLVWLQGLPKGDKADAIVRDATELGATAIVFLALERCVARVSASKQAEKLERWRKIALSAARQCERPDVPAIAGPLTLKAALRQYQPRVLLHERQGKPLVELLSAQAASGVGLSFVAGPEGGFTEAEVELCVAQGVQLASLGTRILRAETVAPAVLGAVLLLAHGAFGAVPSPSPSLG
jgi:16S rRNA (uracil1498-N3)-methyltransferase